MREIPGAFKDLKEPESALCLGIVPYTRDMILPSIPIKKYEDLKNRIQNERGDLDFFGLILRDNAPNTWDLVISAQWAEADKWSALGYLSEILRAELEPQELLQLSRVVILEKESPVFKALVSVPRPSGNSITELHHSSAGDIHFRHAYILAA